LTDFVDFVSASGTPRVTKVREIKSRPDYNPAFDFWRALRQAVVELHEQGMAAAALDRILPELTDGKKTAAYPPLIAAYKKWMRPLTLEWFAPPVASWTDERLTVRLNPELGLRINGVPHVVKLYFKRDPLSARRLAVIFHLMNERLPQRQRGAIPAVLDVPRGKLCLAPAPTAGLGVLLKSEAVAFVTIWENL
jgi:hypothetical protein